MAPKAQKKPAAKAAPNKAPKKAQKKPAAKAAPNKAPKKVQKKPASDASAAPEERPGHVMAHHAGQIGHITNNDLAALRQEWREDRDWNSSYAADTPNFSVWLLSKRWMGTPHELKLLNYTFIPHSFYIHSSFIIFY